MDLLSSVMPPADTPTENRRALTPGVYNLTYKSEVDGSLQPLLVQIPPGYSSGKKWPLLVTLHGRGDGPILASGIDAMIQIGPSGRGAVNFTGIGARDVFDCINVACTLFSIDTDRLYLCGFSMGAGATFDLGLRFPQVWAACVPVCGDYEDLTRIPNARHLPFWIHAGGADIMVPAERVKHVYEHACRLGFAHWRYTEYEKMGHEFTVDWKSIQAWLLTQQRARNPSECTVVTRDLRSSAAYWVTLTALPEYGRPARIDAGVAGQTVTVTTDHALAYALDLRGGLLDTGREVRIVENKREIFHGLLNETGRFVRMCEKPAALRKKPGLSGPLWDIYSAPCLLVYGTGSDRTVVRAARHCAESFADPGWMSLVAFRAVADRDVSDAMLRDYNIVLFGDARSNTVLARLADRLPLRIAGTSIRTGHRVYDAPDIGYVLIYPNPLHPEHYVAVFTGTTSRMIDCFERIWPTFASALRDLDFGVFQLPPGANAVKWLETGVFDTYWQWSDPASAGDSGR